MSQTSLEGAIEIKSISDIAAIITEENRERFMLDFACFIYHAAEIRAKHPDIGINSMLWKDDGVHEIFGCCINGEMIRFSKPNKKQNAGK